MRTPAPPLDSVPFRRLSAELAAWRRTSRPGLRIPSALWDCAVALARKEGVHRVALALGLCGSTLRQRLESADRGRARAHPGFVALPAPGAARPSTAVVLELSDTAANRRLRIELLACAADELAAVARELWRVTR